MGGKSFVTYCAVTVFVYRSGIQGIVKFVEKYIVSLTCSYFFCLCIQCDSGNSPMWYQYNDLGLYGVTRTDGMWILHFQPHRLQGFTLDYFHSQTTVICGIGQIINWWLRRDGQILFKVFFLVSEPAPTIAHYFYISCTLYYIYLSHGGGRVPPQPSTYVLSIHWFQTPIPPPTA